MLEYKYDELYLTEKDSQVEGLAPVLSCNYVRKWYPAYNNDNSVVLIPLQGHLMELLKFPQDYDIKYKAWTEETTFCFPEPFKTKPKQRTIEILNRAVEHIKQAKTIIIASDFDNEGAALAMEVIEYAGAADRVSHMLEMGSMNEDELRDAIDNPIDIPYKSMAAAGYARARIDWAEGMSLSRALTLQLARKKSVIVFGGVKSPLIKMVVDRDIQFEAHKSIKYYYLTGTLKHGDKEFSMKVTREEEEITTSKKGVETKKIVNKREIETKEIAEKIQSQIEALGDLSISEFSRRVKTENAPQLYDLNSLQATVSRLYNLTPEQTLEIAQGLYDRTKIQTYPRTEIKYLKEKEFLDVELILKNLSNVMHKSHIDKILEGTIPKRSTVFNSKKVVAHGALVPTKKDPNESWGSMAEINKKVFAISAERYIENFMPSYEYSAVYGRIHLFDNYYMSFSENIPLKAGYKALKNPEIEETITSYVLEIPKELKKGDSVSLGQLSIGEGETKPKAQFTIETLMNAMKNIASLYPDDPLIKEYLGENGIGTPATRSEILKQLMTAEKRKDKEDLEPWFKMKGKKIISTARAREMIKVVPEDIVSPIKRAVMNKYLKKVETGEITLEQFMAHYKKDIENNIAIITEKGKDPNNWLSVPEKEIDSLGDCPVCSGQIYEKPKAYICTNAAWSKGKEKDDKWVNDGCNYAIWKNTLEKLGGKTFSKLQVKLLLKNKKVEVDLVSPRTNGGYKKMFIIDKKWGGKVDFGEKK